MIHRIVALPLLLLGFSAEAVLRASTKEHRRNRRHRDLVKAKSAAASASGAANHGGSGARHLSEIDCVDSNLTVSSESTSGIANLALFGYDVNKTLSKHNVSVYPCEEAKNCVTLNWVLQYWPNILDGIYQDCFGPEDCIGECRNAQDLGLICDEHDFGTGPPGNFSQLAPICAE